VNPTVASPFTAEVALAVNGTGVRRRLALRQTRVDVLREALDLTGSHVGCGHGVRGACSVRVDGAIVRGRRCGPAPAAGRSMETIERGPRAAIRPRCSGFSATSITAARLLRAGHADRAGSPPDIC
jgi:carbon-monoxide dehydrogenase small subunit